jgi:hypothetical protein
MGSLPLPRGCARLIPVTDGGSSRRRFRLADCADDAGGAARSSDIDRAIAVGYRWGGRSRLLWYRHRLRPLVPCATPASGAGRALGSRTSSAGGPPCLALGARLVPAVRRRLGGMAVVTYCEPEAAPGFRHIATPGAILCPPGDHEFLARVDRLGGRSGGGSDRRYARLTEAQRKLADSHSWRHGSLRGRRSAACVYRPREFLVALLEACEASPLGWRRAAWESRRAAPTPRHS